MLGNSADLYEKDFLPPCRDGRSFHSIRPHKPFLKWAGGKTQLIPYLLKYLPDNFNQYIEPFVGAGALFFYLGHRRSIISDSNEELIITYEQVQTNVSEIINILESYKNEKSHYYTIRELKPSQLSRAERAARLIYLNKTCFNGLFRVNKKDEFNVPYGTRKGSFLNKLNLMNASRYLQDIKIIWSDYKKVLVQFAKKGDLVFLDPPYHPVGKFSDFKRYTKEFFHIKDQIELAEIFERLVNRGCHVILTNSDHPFIIDLFKKFQLEIVETRRLISSNPKTRTGRDIIITGGP